MKPYETPVVESFDEEEFETDLAATTSGPCD